MIPAPAPPPLRRPVGWVLEHSSSIFCDVIRRRIARGEGPDGMARLFAIEDHAFAEIRFDDGRPSLILRVDHAPAAIPGPKAEIDELLEVFVGRGRA